jgi:hypothetical protein
MKISKRAFAFFALASVFVLLSVTLFAEVFRTANSKTNICILTYETAFKKNLTAVLIQDFKAKGMNVTVDTVSNGSNYKASDYNAVILLSAVQAFGPLPKTTEYIIKNKYSSNIIYFSTYSMFNLPYGFSLDKKKIDAVTSASVSSDKKVLEEAKNKIVERAMKVLNK